MTETTAAGVEFGALPENPRNHTEQYPPIAAALRERPNEWAKVLVKRTAKTATGFAGNVRRGSFDAFPRGEFEAAARGCDAWMRYVGGQS